MHLNSFLHLVIILISLPHPVIILISLPNLFHVTDLILILHFSSTCT